MATRASRKATSLTFLVAASPQQVMGFHLVALVVAHRVDEFRLVAGGVRHEGRPC